MSETYEVYAVRYAHVERRATDNFVGGDAHDGPMPMDYFVWVVRNANRTLIVDTGFDNAAASKRGRQLLRPVETGLASIGVDHTAIDTVILTHLHYDHCGNSDLFPNARYYVQDKEMAFATGRCMCRDVFRVHYEADDIVAMVRRTFAGRTTFCDGSTEIAPGITTHFVGGHTAGMQIVRVETARGPVVLASDLSHYYANIEQGRPFPAVYHIGDLLDGYDMAKSLAGSDDRIIPGHDPLVLKRYPSPSAALDGMVARLDLPPRQS